MSDKPLLLTAGDSLTVEIGPITIEDQNGVKAPLDLTQGGLKVWFTVKTSVDDTDAAAVVQVTEGTGIGKVTLNDPATADKNYMTARIAKTVFADPTVYTERVKLVWDAEYELGTRHETVDAGELWVEPQVGRG